MLAIRRNRIKRETGDRSEWREDKRSLGWFYAPKGLRDSARGFNPGNRPINGSALKGRKLTWINPTHIAPQNEFRVCLAVLETHPENLFCDDGFPAWRCTKKPIPWQIG